MSNPIHCIDIAEDYIQVKKAYSGETTQIRIKEEFDTISVTLGRKEIRELITQLLERL